MTELEIAAQLSLIKDGDTVEAFLKMQYLLANADAKKVLTAYQQIKQNEVKVVKVLTSQELTSSQKTIVEQKLTSTYKNTELVFAYLVESSTQYGIEISIGDDLIEFSFS